MDVSLGSIILVLSLNELEKFIPLLRERDIVFKVSSANDKEYFEICEKRKQQEQEDINKHLNIIPNKKYFNCLNRFNERTFGEVFRNEHPQTIACMFSFISPECAAKFILTLPAGVRGEVIRRMSYLYIAQPYFLEKIDDFLKCVTVREPIWTQDKGEAVLKAVGEISPESEEEIRQELRDY